MQLKPSDDSRPKSQDANTNDPSAHRQQLLKKLSCLIAVLEAAISKVRRNQLDKSVDPDRLERIRVNLENTLTICERARVTLERRGMLPANLPPEVREAVGAPNLIPATARQARRRRKADQRMTYRDYVELSSLEEFRRFRALAPIRREEIEVCDLDDLAQKLGGVDAG